MKKELIEQAEKLQKELDILKNKIQAQSEVDLFSITTYKEVCNQLSEEGETCPYKKVKQLERLFNGTWRKNWKDRNQEKWYPWFEYTASGGFWFLGSHCRFYSFGSEVAFFKDKKTSDHVGKHFISIFKEIAEN